MTRSVALLCLLTLFACDDGASESEGTGGTGGGPAPLAPTYTNVRTEVFVSCGFGTCHDTPGATLGGVVIRDEAEHEGTVYDNLVNVDALVTGPVVKSTGEAREPPNVPKRIVPGDPQASFLYWKVLGHSPADPSVAVVGDVMPNGRPLDAARADLVKRWIEAGAPKD